MDLSSLGKLLFTAFIHQRSVPSTQDSCVCLAPYHLSSFCHQNTHTHTHTRTWPHTTHTETHPPWVKLQKKSYCKLWELMGKCLRKELNSNSRENHLHLFPQQAEQLNTEKSRYTKCNFWAMTSNETGADFTFDLSVSVLTTKQWESVQKLNYGKQRLNCEFLC